MKLGCIGDDFTGSSDIGMTLAHGPSGLRTRLYVGVPDEPADPEVEAGIVALKTRSVPVEEAVTGALAALDWLREQGCSQIVFKYCSTFDSTPQGNIGPVAEALAEALGHNGPVIFCPAFPAAGRTIYQGHLFVRDRLLSESGLENHPLTPMTDPDIRRWLDRQAPGRVGHVAWSEVELGVEAARAAMAAEAHAGRPLVICDAVRDKDLAALGHAGADLPLLTGGSGIATSLPEIHGGSGSGEDWAGSPGPGAILSGSCSSATRDQIEAHIADGAPARRIDAAAAVAGTIDPEELAAWALETEAGPVLPLIYSSADPAEVEAAQRRHGRQRVADALEVLFGRVAQALFKAGADRLIVAGGETSGAVVSALELDALEIGPPIAPGVAALSVPGRDMVLALKSGNFGDRMFFSTAGRILAGEEA